MLLLSAQLVFCHDMIIISFTFYIAKCYHHSIYWINFDLSKSIREQSPVLLYDRVHMLRFKFPSLQKKPYSAITVQVDRLTSGQYAADDMSGIVDLIEVIRLQSGGPSEAARAIRKKLCVLAV